VVKALMLNGLMPRVLGGSSAGSIVTAIIATRTDEECFRDFFNVKGTDAPGHSGKINTDFFRPVGYDAAGGDDEAVELTSSQYGSFKRAFQLFFPLTLRNLTSVVYDVITGFKRPKDILKSDTRHLESCLRNNIGDFTFQEAFDRTGRILNITVSPQSRSDPPRLLNYLTSPHVLIWSAALASASLPGVFEANRLKVKDADGREIYETTSGMAFQDGSMEADLPMQQLSEMFNINHFIISQANPHAVMFANFGLERSVWAHPLVGYVNSILSFMKNQVCDHFHKYSSFITHCVSKFIPTFSTNSTRSFGAIFATCSTFLVVEGLLLCGTQGEIWGLNFSPKNTRDEKPISL
jgi:TAG lipase/steryl ester hydrolase/phospholipase A2/LPA acyltransferase